MGSLAAIFALIRRGSQLAKATSLVVIEGLVEGRFVISLAIDLEPAGAIERHRVDRVSQRGQARQGLGIVGALETALPVHSSATRGLDPHAREALVFAGLGVRAVLGEPSSNPAASGARAGRILGKISTPAR